MEREVRSAETTFSVADVEPAGGPLEEASSHEALQGLLAGERPTKGVAYRQIEAISRHSPRLVAGIGYHPFVAALHLAYAGHRPITLSPDMVWLLIGQGLAHHIRSHAEDLRPKFVLYPGRLTLQVERAQDVQPKKGSDDSPWPEVFDAFSAQIRAHIGPTCPLLPPSFSTTGPVERAAAEITLFDSVQNYHHYLFETVNCGIPAITLEGTVADWQSIVERAEELGDLGLEWWLGPLRPLLQKLALAAAGEVDAEFWNRIYRVQKPAGASEKDIVTGWISAFFPYLAENGGRGNPRNPWLAGDRKIDESLDLETSPRWKGLSEGRFPSGLAKAPLTWDERDTEGRLLHRRELQLLGGFVGVAQDSATLSLRPEIGWAVRGTGWSTTEGPAGRE